MGGIANALRWLEVLAAALFTLDATGSAFAVAAVSAARALPLLVVGALAGVISDAMDRKHILLGGMLLTAVSSGAVAVLAEAGAVRPWHLFVASFVSGLVYATEMPARRRMVGESAGPALAERAVALDSLTGSLSRVAGPLLGGVAYEMVGLAGAFAGSAALSLVAVLVTLRVHHQQRPRKLRLRHVVSDAREGLAFARQTPAVIAVLGVTVAMNLFGFSYAALVPSLGRLMFDASPALVGVLAAAEPSGAFTAGLVLAVVTLPGCPVWLLLGGTALPLLMMVLVPAAQVFWLACALMLAGGLGVAAFINLQTTIALDATPTALRSRVMGIVTMGIGTCPIGMLLAGALSDRIGPLDALETIALSGLSVLLATAIYWARQSSRVQQSTETAQGAQGSPGEGERVYAVAR
jgi:MFS family permease